MGTVVFSDDVTVDLMDASADDSTVCAAARVSTIGNESKYDWTVQAREGLIKYLMSNRHGTPFEHNYFTFFVKAPIFVFREFHRHRIGWSYNEESARYKQLDPEFYIPASTRPGMMQVEGGKPGQYHYVDANYEHYKDIEAHLKAMSSVAYARYTRLLDIGVAKEVARMCLPVNIYSSMYATCNARSLMAFLSLRQKHTKREPYALGRDGDETVEWEGEAFFPSKPQHEINMVADKMASIFEDRMPITARLFRECGYVAP